jgi:hypothetical protein
MVLTIMMSALLYILLIHLFANYYAASHGNAESVVIVANTPFGRTLTRVAAFDPAVLFNTAVLFGDGHGTE